MVVLDEHQTPKNGWLFEEPLDGHEQFISEGVHVNTQEQSPMNQAIYSFAHWVIQRYAGELMLGELYGFEGVLTDVTFICPW